MSVSRTKLLCKCRNDLIDIHRHALDAVKPENLIRNSVLVSNQSLVIKSKAKSFSYDLNNTRIHVVGGGKSVLGMARGLADLAQGSHIHQIFSHGCLSLPVGLEVGSASERTLTSIGVKCLFGSRNNLPDQASVESSENILETISDASRSDRAQRHKSLFIVLISGGGSACLTSPRYVSLSKKLEMIEFLAQRGANIVELNKMRRYYSNLKGGGLARYIRSKNPSAKILSLILSDVIGDPIEFIASGPTCLQHGETVQLRREQAHQVLARYGYGPMEHQGLKIEDDDQCSMTSGELDIVNHVIGNNQLATEAALHRARSLGYEVMDLGSDLQGDTKSVLEKLVGAAKEHFDGSNAADRLFAIGGGEVTVTKAEGETWGKGGRAQEMALDYLISQLSRSKPDQGEIDMLLAGTTDGQDGPTDVGACLASYAEIVDKTLEGGLQLEDALRAKTSHDSYNFWMTTRPQCLIKTGLTGTNVMDLYMYSLTKMTVP